MNSKKSTSIAYTTVYSQEPKSIIAKDKTINFDKMGLASQESENKFKQNVGSRQQKKLKQIISMSQDAFIERLETVLMKNASSTQEIVKPVLKAIEANSTLQAQTIKAIEANSTLQAQILKAFQDFLQKSQQKDKQDKILSLIESLATTNTKIISRINHEDKNEDKDEDDSDKKEISVNNQIRVKHQDRKRKMSELPFQAEIKHLDAEILENQRQRAQRERDLQETLQNQIKKYTSRVSSETAIRSFHEEEYKGKQELGKKNQTEEMKEIRNKHYVQKFPKFLVKKEQDLEFFDSVKKILRAEVVNLIIKAHCSNSLPLDKVFEAGQLFEVYMEINKQIGIGKFQVIAELLVNEEIQQEKPTEEKEIEIAKIMQARSVKRLSKKFNLLYYYIGLKQLIKIEEKEDMAIKYLLLACLYHPFEEKYSAYIVAAATMFVVLETSGNGRTQEIIAHSKINIKLLQMCGKQIWFMWTKIDTIDEMSALYKFYSRKEKFCVAQIKPQ